MLFPTLLCCSTQRANTLRTPKQEDHSHYMYIDDINYPQVITYVGSCADARSVPSEAQGSKQK